MVEGDIHSPSVRLEDGGRIDGELDMSGDGGGPGGGAGTGRAASGATAGDADDGDAKAEE